MTERGPILCATDLTPAGARAVDLAARLAGSAGRPLRLVHVTAPGPDLTDVRELDEAERVLKVRLRQRVEAAAAALEKERERATGLGPHAEAELLEGRPWEMVVQRAKELQASVVVVGPHGSGGALQTVRRSGLVEWILGSTADRVVRHAPCPVLVGFRDEHEVAPLSRRKWLVAIDFSEPARAALRVADGLAKACQSTLVPVHVEPRTHEEPFALADTPSETQQRLAELAQEILGREVEVQLAFGDAARSIALAAEKLDATMIVMGTRGHTGLAHLLLGSTAERTLRRASVPVLCVRPDAT